MINEAQFLKSSVDVLVGDGNYTPLCRKCLAKKGIKIRKKVK